MKKVYLFLNLIGVIFIFSLSQIFMSCTTKNSSNEPTTDTGDQKGLNSCNALVYGVYPQAAAIWTNTWLHNNEHNIDNGLRTISAQDLKGLFNQVNDTSEMNYGLRFYYALVTDTSSVPDLVITSTQNCRDMISKEGQVLLVTTEKSEMIDIREAANYTKRWQVKAKPVFSTNVYAYNYNMDQIRKFTSDDSGKIDVFYGLRTLSPEEYNYEFGSETQKNTKSGQSEMYGNVVYLNVIYTRPEGIPRPKVRSRRDEESEDDFVNDFARPCPRFCDPDSDLVSDI